MDDPSPTPRPFTIRVLPWILGALFFVLYAVSLHPWVGPNNVLLIGQLLGWEPDLAYTEPVLYLVTAPVRWVSPARIPFALNLVAAAVGALNVLILARCVALLPHDRTREQRIRGHSEEPLLHGWFASIPIILAAGLLGLQLTFWENATLQTGEMLDLLLFAFCILALLEYRLELREGWLWASAFVWGVGVTNNWAMIGFAPLYIAAVAWIRGWSFFHAGFLTRMILWGLAGLAFFFVVPLIGLGGGDTGLGFWETLKANLNLDKFFLFGVPRGRPLILALVAVLPLGLVGIRWQGSAGSTVERYATFGGILLLQLVWLAAAVYMAFDPPFSPRRMMYLDESTGGLPFLTFSFTGTLAAGYFAGWFLLVGLAPAGKTWDQPNVLFRGLGKLVAVLVLVTAVGAPVLLLVRNWPVIHAQNNGDSWALARALIEPLPANPVLAISDNPVMARLARAAVRTRPETPPHVFLETLQGPDPRYRNWLVKSARNTLPQLAPIASAKENVAGIMTDIMRNLAGAGRAYYLHPSFGFFFEQVRARPLGVVFKLEPQPAKLGPQVGTLEEGLAALRAWDAQAATVTSVIGGRNLGSRDSATLGSLWSRSADALGVELQRLNRLEDAGRLFRQALQLNPENRSAEVNRAVNEALLGKKPLTAELARVVADEPMLRVLNAGGPLDEPGLLTAYGFGLLNAGERLPRQAWDAFYRADQLAPGQFGVQLGKIEALLQAGQFPAARASLDALAQSSSRSKEEAAGVQRLEIFYSLTQGDIAGAEKRIENARTQFANDLTLLDLLTRLYIQQRRYDESIPLLEQWRKQRPDDVTPLLRTAAIHLAREQYEPALRLVDQVLVVQSDNPVARLNRAVCLFRLNRLDDAKREYVALQEQLPDLPMLHFGLAEIALRRGDTNAALVAFEKYLQFAPTNTVEYSNVVTRVAGMRRR